MSETYNRYSEKYITVNDLADTARRDFWYKHAKLLDYTDYNGKKVLFGQLEKSYYVWSTDFSVFEPVPSKGGQVYKSEDREDAYNYFTEIIKASQVAQVQYNNNVKGLGLFSNTSTSDVNYKQMDKSAELDKEYSIFKSYQQSFLTRANRYDYATFDFDTLCVGNINTPNYEEWRVWVTKSVPSEQDETKVRYLGDNMNKDSALDMFKGLVSTAKKKMVRNYMGKKIEYLEKANNLIS